MGTLTFAVTKYAASRGQAAATLSSDVRLFGTHATSTTASNVEVSSTDITVNRGEVVVVSGDEAMWVSVVGTAGTDESLPILADQPLTFEVHQTGNLSVVDVA